MTNGPNDTPILKIVDSHSKKPKPKKQAGSGGGSRSGETWEDGPFRIINGAFHQAKPSKDGTVNVFPLCNGVVKVTKEINHDTGLIEKSLIQLSGTLKNGAQLPTIEMSVDEFFSTQPVFNRYWGTRFYIPPGVAKRDNLRACIQRYSGNVPRVTTYGYIGFINRDEGYIFLHGGGAISADAVLDDEHVKLTGTMANYCFPAPLPHCDELKTAIKILWLIINICPNKRYIGFALLAALARAPLAACLPIDFAIWLHGLTGSRKSSIASLIQNAFGTFGDQFPGNFSDTANALEKKLFQAFCCIFVADDCKLSGTKVDVAKIVQLYTRLIMNTGDQAGRDRLGMDQDAIGAAFNRSMLVVTAEDSPEGQSTAGRLLILLLTRLDVDNVLLSQLQRAAADGLFRLVVSSYIKWLAAKMGELKKNFPKQVEQARDAYIRDGVASSHPRAPKIRANLQVALELFVDFCEEVGAFDTGLANELIGQCETSLNEAFSLQSEYQAEHDDVGRFLRLLRAALASGNAHVSCRLNQGPPPSHPYAWGWRDAGTSLAGDKNYNRMGDCIGWYSAETGTTPAELWLNQETAFKCIQQFTHSQGGHFATSAAKLWRLLHERGFILSTEKRKDSPLPRLDVKRTIAGRSERVLVMPASALESGD